MLLLLTMTYVSTACAVVIFKVDLNLANVEADLLLVDCLYYKLATIHVLALLLSHVSHEI